MNAEADIHHYPLDINRQDGVERPVQESPITGMDIVVVGSGAGGLAFAKAAQERGANVTVIEQAGHPDDPNNKAAFRSFNFSLNIVGRGELKDPRAWEGSAPLLGRAVHNFMGTGEVRLADYGTDPTSYLHSITRPLFRRNLSGLVEASGAKLVFNAKVKEVDPDKAVVVYERNAQEVRQSADLIVLADGVHSAADNLITQLDGGYARKPEDAFRYVSVLLGSELGHNLAVDRLHLWHEDAGTYAIGVPNPDGSVGIILLSTYDHAAPDARHAFTDPAEAEAILKRDFPQIFTYDPNLPHVLPSRELGRFYYKRVSHMTIGNRVAVLGDAAHAVPPWAGFGANSAIYMAGFLERTLEAFEGNRDEALRYFQTYYRAFVSELQEYVLEHGKFLHVGARTNPERRAAPALPGIIRTAYASSLSGDVT